MENNKNTIEVCFSPRLYEDRLTRENFIVVIVDILRATTSICSAFNNGVKKIIPIASLDEAREYKKKGFLVASERDGIVSDFADFGNSAFNFMTPEVVGKTIVYSTTNGTHAIEMAKSAEKVVIGAFTNLKPLAEWLVAQDKNVVILCAGWKNKFNLEDSFFAGALVESLLKYPNFRLFCDSATAALDIWKTGKQDMLGYIEKALHRHRLKRMGLDDVLEYSFTLNSTDVIPVLENQHIININKNEKTE
ncbi:MAG: 2-phosphosulfolactate phosphatase [Bacteroidales bacterium]|nr:2-phosphosulfolactate phosphatase [Bacteroidales bacterium]